MKLISKKVIKGALLVSICSSLVLVFQNCGRAGSDGSLDEASIVPESSNLKALFGTDAPKVSATPFAFDVGFDQITYNSCASEGTENDSNYFTVKAGAYTNAGVSLNQNFFDYTKANFAPIHPAKELSVNQLKRFLAYSPENSDAQLQMAIRFSGNLRTGIPSAGTPLSGKDFINVAMDLTDDRMMDPLFMVNTVPPPQRRSVVYFPLAPKSHQRVVEGSLSINSNPAAEHQLRKLLMGSESISVDGSNTKGISYLTLTYLDKSEGAPLYAARGPAGKEKNLDIAFGKKYKLDFSLTPSRYSQFFPITTNLGVHINNPGNILYNITELSDDNPNITTAAANLGNSEYRWDCSRVYTVVRPIDQERNPAMCPAEGINAVTDPNYVSEIQIARHHLPANAWRVNTQLGCVVPMTSGTSCYPTSQVPDIENAGVAYDLKAPCFHETSNPTPVGIIPRCANHITICIRVRK